MDKIIKDSSHRAIKKIHFLISERYPLYSYCHGIEISGILLRINVLKPLREVKRPLHIVLCKESHYDLIDILGSFSVTLLPWKFYKVAFTYSSCPGTTARKITNILRSFDFWLELRSFKSTKYSWWYKLLKKGNFPLAHPGI